MIIYLSYIYLGYNTADLLIRHALHDINGFISDGFRAFCCHILNVDSSLRGSNDHWTLSSKNMLKIGCSPRMTDLLKNIICYTYIETALHHDGNIELTTGELALSDHDHVADTASCSSLLCYQELFQHLAC